METFRWTPDPSDIVVGESYETLISDMYIGPEERRAVSGPKRNWSLKFRKNRTEANEIWNFYLDRRGSFEAFWFNCPVTKQRYAARFQDDELSRAVFWRKVYEFGLRIVEVYLE